MTTSSARDRRRAFALQAQADLATRQILCEHSEREVPTCHKLQFLQMACEKLVKAHLFSEAVIPKDAESSHAVIAKHLHRILAEYYRRTNRRQLPAHLRQRIRAISRQIELLAPAVDDAGRQRANCEYPWTHAGKVYVPAEYTFSNINLVEQPAAILILKLIPIAIDELVH